MNYKNNVIEINMMKNVTLHITQLIWMDSFFIVVHHLEVTVDRCVVSNIASFYFYAIGFGTVPTIWHYSAFIDNMRKHSI